MENKKQVIAVEWLAEILNNKAQLSEFEKDECFKRKRT